MYDKKVAVRPGGSVKAEGLGDGCIASKEDHRQAALDDATQELPVYSATMLSYTRAALSWILLLSITGDMVLWIAGFGHLKGHEMKRQAAKTCPVTGREVCEERARNWPAVLLPITGLLALIWFLVRVVPKPSRAAYPCQRAAAPLASAFVVWIAGLIGSMALYRRSKRLMHQSRYILAAVCTAAAAAPEKQPCPAGRRQVPRPAQCG